MDIKFLKLQIKRLDNLIEIKNNLKSLLKK